MSYLQVTAFRPSLRVSDQCNTLHGPAIQCIAPVNIFNLRNSPKANIGSSKKCTELMTHHMIQRTGASHYPQCTPVCLFGGKGESKNDKESSPWKPIEKAMSGFKKEESLEDLLRQQMEKQDYYDGGGSGGNPPTGGGGGGGFGGTEDEGFAGIMDDILQVTFAILALAALYVYVVAREQVMLFLTDSFQFLSGKRGPRLRTIMYHFGRFYQKLRARPRRDPYWLEKAIISTPTFWDSPRKYKRMLRASRRASRSSKRAIDSDDDDEDSDSNNAYRKKTDFRKKAYDANAYDDDSDNNDNDDNGYSEDVDGDF